jgi:uncharacterized Tic20 family protein
MAQTAQHAVFDPSLAPGRILLWHHDRQEEPVVNPYEPPASPVEPIPSTSADERTWAMIAHFAALGAFIIPVIGGVLGPLIVWLAKREQSAFVADAAKEALNFNISVVLAGVACVLLVFVFIGIPLSAALFVFWLVMTVIAGIKASEGVPYRYPVSLRLVK